VSATIGGVKRIHWLSGGLGILLLVAGLMVVFVPGLEGALPLDSAFVGLVAVAAIGLGMWRIRIRYNSTLDHTELPVPELPFALPTPGDDLDGMLYRYTRLGEATLEYPERIGERLREVAIATIAHRQSISRDEALDRLEDGSWTDNQYAAAFFSEEISAPEPSLGDRFQRSLGRGDNPYEHQVEETVDAIVSVAALVQDTGPSPADDEEDEGLLARLSGGGDELQEAVELDRTSVQEYDEDEGELVAEGVRYHDTRWTGRWLGIEAFALVAAGLGVATVQPGLLLFAAVGAVYAAYARSTGQPELRGLSVERTLSDTQPFPGEEVTVTVTVENVGGTFLPDLRLVDLVAPNMRVVDGSPRQYTALRPGAHARFQYTVIAERGAHEWSLLAVGSGFAGSIEQEAVIEPEGDTTINCLPRLRTVSEVPVRSQTTVYSGQVNTDLGGAGLEFHSVREYQPNDPMRRVEWKRLARTGELATIDLREERAATVLLLFDAREGAYVASGPGEQHALDRSIAAASEVYAALSDSGNLVGIAAFDTVPCWLGPGAGTGHDEAARQLLAHHPAMSSLPPQMQDLDGGYVDPMTHIRRQLGSGSQVMMFSPLISQYPAEVARRLDSAGHRVSVISPDPTADRTAGQQLARVERAIRINRLREHGINVIDWGTDETLGLSLQRANRRLTA
jgi:uncharacterized repeat protein (TIGR01451 family)